MAATKSSDAVLQRPLIDPFGRRVSYLRLSVTDRCDLRCHYCMSARPVFLPKAQLLTLEELGDVVEEFVDLGVNKVRLTGGEPLVRRDVMTLVERVGKILREKAAREGKKTELCMTSNATRLSKFAETLAGYGMDRINVSLDTLDADTYRELTRGGDLEQTLNGIEAALAAGIEIKLNLVALKGINIDHIDSVIEFCGEKGIALTIIEVMPMGDISSERRLDNYYELTRLMGEVSERWNLVASKFSSGGPARYYDCLDTGQKIGFISPLSHNFCATCNRVRVTATGMLYPCLGNMGGVALKGAQGRTELRARIMQAIDRKPKSHEFSIDQTKGKVSGTVARNMNVTGG